MINVIEKSQADYLLSKGYKYTIQKLADGQEYYQFQNNKKLKKELTSKYGVGSFFMTKYTNF